MASFALKINNKKGICPKKQNNIYRLFFNWRGENDY